MKTEGIKMDPRIEADVALRKVLKRMVLGIRNVSRNLLLTNVTSQERKSKWANVTFYQSINNGRDTTIGGSKDFLPENSSLEIKHSHTSTYHLLGNSSRSNNYHGITKHIVNDDIFCY